MATQQNALVTLVVDGRPLGVFDSSSGGDVTAEPAKHRPGGMAAMKSYPALPDYDDVTVSRVYERERDHELIRGLRSRVGKAPVIVSEQPLDENGGPWGRPTTYVGRLISIAPGESDSKSADTRMFELGVQVTEVR